MRVKVLSFLILAMVAGAGTMPEPAAKPVTGDVIRLWADRAPRAAGDTDADIPTLTAFLPDPNKANGCAVVICPGGGYEHLAVGYEGAEIGKWLSSHGVAAFMLKYRLAPYGQPVPMLDGQRAIRVLRYNAKAWGIDPHRLGIMGFSAGGHVASTVGTHYDSGITAAPDPINLENCRPDFMLLVYPVITMKAKITHPGSRQNLLGTNPVQKLVDLYSNELQVTNDTPPAFIVHSKTDPVVPVANSQLFYDALKRHKIPSEFLELPTGGHGYGMGSADPKLAVWTDRCLAWMIAQRFMTPEAK